MGQTFNSNIKYILFLFIFFFIAYSYTDTNAYSINNMPQWIEEIGLIKVWDIEKGSPRIIIAILDTGIAENNYCFKNNIIHKYNILKKNDDVSSVP